MDSAEPASVEDYFSDNTMGRKEHLLMRRQKREVERRSALKPCIALKSAFMSVSDFERAMERLVPVPMTPDSAPARGPFRDADVVRVAELLALFGKEQWSYRPRTFAILRMIGCTEAIDGFIADRLSDISLPYTERNLPSAVKGPQARSRFIDLQGLVLTPHVADLEKGGASHKHFPRGADNYYISKKELGSGGFGQVDHVWSRLSLGGFARKRIPRGRSFKRDKVAIANFEKELKVLKLLSHRHLVRLMGSYTDPDYVGLIMCPVADMNLETYLTSTEIDSKDRQILLRRFTAVWVQLYSISI